MGLEDVKALTFDTGGTILDWHTGFSNALAKAGASHGLDRDWPGIANELRRRSLRRMVNLGKDAPPEYNFDDSHRVVLNELIAENGLEAITEKERYGIWWTAAHNLAAWPDFPPVLPKLREKFICASMTILSFRIVIDAARRNNLSWDAVISCEGIGKYKALPEAYLTAAQWLQLKPEECCMVACHNFDLDAAKNAGFKTAFVRRPDEWGAAGPPDPEPNPKHDIVAADFPDLARQLAVQI